MQWNHAARRIVWPTILTLLVALVVRPALAGPSSALPAPIKGWQQVGATESYDRNNLYNLIDGEAEAVLTYAFAGCVNASYAPAGSNKPEVTIMVFDMTDPLNAFGLFGSDRISGTPVPIGAEGVFIKPSGLNFWKGRYVVRATILHPTPANVAALHAFARASAARITGSGGIPPIVKALPPGRQPRSEKYVRENVAGQAMLTNAITARYPALGQGAELFIAQYSTPRAATSAFNQYWNYFYHKGVGPVALKGIGNDAFRAQDNYAKGVMAVVKGRYVIGMHHARDVAAAQRLVVQAMGKVK